MTLNQTSLSSKLDFAHMLALFVVPPSGGSKETGRLKAGLRARHLTVLLSLFVLLGKFTAIASAARSDRLRVCLVSGASVYESDRTLEKLKRNLEAFYPFDCTLVLQNPTGEGFDHIEALRDTDVALFVVRRKTPPPAALAEIRKFMDSGKGLVAIGPTSHAWENWPTFDVDVLGAKYSGSFADRKGITDLRLHRHPILTGGEDYSTNSYIYNYKDVAKDVQVLIEGGVGTQYGPMAWTRERNGTRIFYFKPAYPEDFNKISYFRIVANSIFWVARREIPGTGTRINQTWLPDTHPGSIAIGFSSGLNFCFDPIRGAIAYAWDGDYVDLAPTMPQGSPRNAIIRGNIFHRPPAETGFRTKDNAPSEIRFRGYRLENNRPRFHYEINGLDVMETVSPKEDRTGLVRHFRVTTPSRAFRFRPTGPGQITILQGPASTVEGEIQLPGRTTIEFSEFLSRPTP